MVNYTQITKNLKLNKKKQLLPNDVKCIYLCKWERSSDANVIFYICFESNLIKSDIPKMIFSLGSPRDQIFTCNIINGYFIRPNKTFSGNNIHDDTHVFYNFEDAYGLARKCHKNIIFGYQGKEVDIQEMRN